MNIRKAFIIIFAIVCVLAVLTLDDPEFYGPGNTCPTNHPTNCN